MESVEKTGKTIADALAEALQELNLTAEQVDVEVLEEPKKAILGLIGGRKAKIRVTPKILPAEPENKTAAALSETAEPETAVKSAPVSTEVPAAVAAAAAAVTAASVETSAAASKNSVGGHNRREPKEFLVDEKAIEAAKVFLNKIFEAMKITVSTEKFINRSNGIITLKLHGDDMGILIGKHGQTLDALQYLTNLVANRAAQGRMRIIIDVEDYRDRRAETLTRLAKRLAEKVKRTGERCVLEPMNPHERKIIHTALQEDDAVTTLSEGLDPYRKVVIELKK